MSSSANIPKSKLSLSGLPGLVGQQGISPYTISPYGGVAFNLYGRDDELRLRSSSEEDGKSIDSWKGIESLLGQNRLSVLSWQLDGSNCAALDSSYREMYVSLTSSSSCRPLGFCVKCPGECSWFSSSARASVTSQTDKMGWSGSGTPKHNTKITARTHTLRAVAVPPAPL